jgi:hypothetical protein
MENTTVNHSDDFVEISKLLVKHMIKYNFSTAVSLLARQVVNGPEKTQNFVVALVKEQPASALQLLIDVYGTRILRMNIIGCDWSK